MNGNVLSGAFLLVFALIHLPFVVVLTMIISSGLGVFHSIGYDVMMAKISENRLRATIYSGMMAMWNGMFIIGSMIGGIAGYMLSSGLMRMLLLNIPIARETPILILDEPTAMVDIISKTQIWERIYQLKNENRRGILIASHDMNEIKSLCDRVYVMVKGKIIAEGSPEEISTLMKMPVEMTFIPSDGEKVELILEFSLPVSFTKHGSVFDVSFEYLNYTPPCL
ncbi:hypothetical protein [Thermoanaerobacter mathranii]|uniref:hypothetical protein n=1 Tax=Thermoanaerobacter mathranii TaxID=583357 RepID=UPI003D6BA0A7